jgi:hypothetical protein
MGFDASQSFRYSEDFTLAIPSILGVAPYQVWLVNIINDQISFNQTNSLRVETRKRILVADGYRSYAPNDGYLNPMIEQLDNRTIVISNGQLDADTLLLGPIVFPYILNGFSGGIDPLSTFQPPRSINSNQQIYIQILGNGLATTGNYFRVDTILLKESLFQLSYRVLLKSIGSNVP